MNLCDALQRQRDELAEPYLRVAWEAGFKLCRDYGNNWMHFDDEQKERQWQFQPRTGFCIGPR